MYTEKNGHIKSIKDRLYIIALVGIVLCLILRLIIFVTELDIQTARKKAVMYEVEARRSEARAQKLVLNNEIIRARIFAELDSGEYWQELK